MVVCRLRGKIIRTGLCRVVYDSCAQRYAHQYEQFLKFIRRFNLDFLIYLQCFDAVDWASGRASGLSGGVLA